MPHAPPVIRTRRRPARAIARWLSALLLLSGAALAHWPLTIIDLHHRLAEDLVPMLAPLAGADGQVSGHSASLFVRASPARLADLRAALSRLDTPQRNLLVELRRAQARSARGAGIAVGIDAPVGASARVRIGTPPGTYSAGVQARAASISANAEILQQVRVLDGGEAFIAIGSSAPVAREERWRGPDGVVTRSARGYASTTTGFYARPRVQGDQVVVDLDSRAGAWRPGGGIDSGALSTQVSGRLGEWLPLGGVSEQNAHAARDLLSAGSTSATSQADLELRVRALD